MFEEFKNIIENNNNQEDMDKAIEKLDIPDDSVDELIEKIFNLNESLNLNNLPYALESLYKSDNKKKFMFFCILLEATFDKIPYITNLEQIPLFQAKLEYLYPTLAIVFENTYNGIGDCLGEIILNNDSELSLADEENKNKIVNSINKKLEMMIEYLENNAEIDNSVYYSLEIILDLSTHINNEDTVNLIEKISDLNLNETCKLFLIKTRLENNLNVSDDLIEKMIDSNPYKLLTSLSKIDRMDIVKDKNITQESVARYCMIDWLKYPTELGDSLDKIEYVDKFEINDVEYYIYKFTSTSDRFASQNYMIGVTGGFPKGIVTADNTGCTFSKFETIADDYINQAKEIVEMIMKYYQERTNN